MAVEDFFSAELGIPKHADDELRYNCPFCSPNEDHKLYLHVGTKTINGRPMYGNWHCFKCGAKGNPPSFVMQLYGMSFREALDELQAYDYDHEMSNWQSPSSLGLSEEEYLLLALRDQLIPREVEAPTYTPPPLPLGYKRIVDNLYNPEVYPFLAYAQYRGFTMDDIVKHNVGYVIDSKVPLPSGKSIRLTNHLVFLTHGMQGEYIYWNTRAIGDSFVKSVNAPSADGEYSKRTVVFNLNSAVRTSCIVINEGVPDALTVGDSGVATFGKQVTEEQKQLLLANISDEQPIYILLDNDAKEQIVKLAESLYAEHPNTFIVVNKKGDDANKMGREAAWELIKNSSIRADTQGRLTFMLAMY